MFCMQAGCGSMLYLVALVPPSFHELQLTPSFVSRLPVRGLLFFCPVCSHGGHHECYREYYLHRPMVPFGSKGARPSLVSFGGQGWGLAALVKSSGIGAPDSSNRHSVDRPESALSHSDLSSSLSKERDREGSILTSVASLAVLGLGANTKEKAPPRDPEKPVMHEEREYPRDKPKDSRGRLMGHPCAAGCGHHCWSANDPPP